MKAFLSVTLLLSAAFAQDEPCVTKGGQVCAVKSELGPGWQDNDFTSEGDDAPCFNMDAPVIK